MMSNRSVIEIMVLVFTFIIGFFIVGLGVLILIIEVKDPEADTSVIANSLGILVSGILGALLGLLAGKTEASQDFHRKPGGGEDGL